MHNRKAYWKVVHIPSEASEDEWLPEKQGSGLVNTNSSDSGSGDAEDVPPDRTQGQKKIYLKYLENQRQPV